MAILVGDLAFVYADQLMHGAPLPAWEIWTELRIELNVGQYLDIVGTVRGERSRHGPAHRPLQERQVHRRAPAAPRRRPGRSRPGRDLLPSLSAYGLPLGDAFQLRDDVLGAFGETALTGKPVGDDLREGKPTPLMAMATARADAGRPTCWPSSGAPT